MNQRWCEVDVKYGDEEDHMDQKSHDKECDHVHLVYRSDPVEYKNSSFSEGKSDFLILYIMLLLI